MQIKYKKGDRGRFFVSPKRRHRTVPCLLLCIILSVNSYAASVSELQDKQEETQEKIDDTVDKIEEKTGEINELNEEANRISESLSELDRQMSTIDQKIASANADIKSAKADIDVISEEIEEIQSIQNERHEIMKRHLVFFYENKGKTDLLTMFLTSDSLAEFINRSEMVQAIVEYDKKIMEEYTAAQDDLIARQDELEIRKSRLTSRKKDLKESQKEMDVLVASAKNEALENADDIDKKREELEKFQAKLTDLKAKMKALEASVAAAQYEEAKRLAEMMQAMQDSGEVENTAGAYAASASDLTLLAATIEAEAGNQPTYGQQAVASVIMNRVMSSLFPDTIYGVITQENQFASYRSGMVDAIIERGPSEECIAVAQEAIDGGRVGDWFFFMTVPYADKYGITGYEVIGDHAFFYRWGAN